MNSYGLHLTLSNFRTIQVQINVLWRLNSSAFGFSFISIGIARFKIRFCRFNAFICCFFLLLCEVSRLDFFSTHLAFEIELILAKRYFRKKKLTNFPPFCKHENRLSAPLCHKQTDPKRFGCRSRLHCTP